MIMYAVGRPERTSCPFQRNACCIVSFATMKFWCSSMYENNWRPSKDSYYAADRRLCPASWRDAFFIEVIYCRPRGHPGHQMPSEGAAAEREWECGRDVEKIQNPCSVVQERIAPAYTLERLAGRHCAGAARNF